MQVKKKNNIRECVMLSKSRDKSQCTGAYHNPINRHVTELEPLMRAQITLNLNDQFTNLTRARDFMSEKKKSRNPLVKTNITLPTVT